MREAREAEEVLPAGLAVVLLVVEGSRASRMPLEESIKEPIKSGGGCGEVMAVERLMLVLEAAEPPVTPLADVENIFGVWIWMMVESSRAVDVEEKKEHKSVRHTKRATRETKRRGDDGWVGFG